jgi:hypothetical protein
MSRYSDSGVSGKIDSPDRDLWRAGITFDRFGEGGKIQGGAGFFFEFREIALRLDGKRTFLSSVTDASHPKKIFIPKRIGFKGFDSGTDMWTAFISIQVEAEAQQDHETVAFFVE